MVPKEQFAKRLKEALQMRGMKQIELAERTGIDRGTICHYLKADYTPKKDQLARLGVALRVNPLWLMGYEIPSQLPAAPVLDKGAKIPILGTVAAGSPIYAEQNVVGYEIVNTSMGENLFALQIHGTSMEPRICDGDVVIVRQQDDAESGQVVIALIGNEEATCKRFVRYDDGTVALLPFNQAFAPLVFPAGRAEEVKIIGIVLESRSRFA